MTRTIVVDLANKITAMSQIGAVLEEKHFTGLPVKIKITKRMPHKDAAEQEKFKAERAEAKAQKKAAREAKAIERAKARADKQTAREAARAAKKAAKHPTPTPEPEPVQEVQPEKPAKKSHHNPAKGY
jgi:membrane protein involved in colicin uptake